MNRAEAGRVSEYPLKTRITWIFGFVLLLWCIEVVNWLTGHTLNSSFGLVPREINGLPGIVLCPFLHGSFMHLLLNSIPLLVMGALVMVRGSREFFTASAIIIIAGGGGVWLLGRSSVHVGASGLVFGYFGFLLARGWYIRDFTSIIFAVFTLLFYGGLIWGIFPSVQTHVSWEGHLFGLLAGILAVRVCVDKMNRDR